MKIFIRVHYVLPVWILFLYTPYGLATPPIEITGNIYPTPYACVFLSSDVVCTSFMTNNHPDENRIRCWDVVSGKEVDALPDEGRGNIRHLAVSGDGRYLAATGGLKIWDLKQKAILPETPRLTIHTDAVDFVNGNRDAIVIGRAKQIQILDFINDKVVGEFEIKAGRIPSGSAPTLSLDVAPNSNFMVASLNGIRMWDMKSLKEVAVIQPADERYARVAVSPDSTRVAYIGSNILRVWDVATQRNVFEKNVKDAGDFFSFPLLWSPDGNSIVVATHRYGVHMLDARNGQMLKNIYPEPFGATAVAYSPDGKYFAACGQGEIRITELKTGKLTTIKQTSLPERK